MLEGTIKILFVFFKMVRGSAAEVITQLHIAFEIGYLDKGSFEKIEDFTEKIKASLTKLVQSRQG